MALLVIVAACDSVSAPAPPMTDCEMWQTAPQTIGNGSIEVDVRFDAGTCPNMTLPAGRWLVLAKITWSVNHDGRRGSSLFVNGRYLDDESDDAAIGYTYGKTLMAVVVSDGSSVVRVTASQNTTGPIATVPAYQTEHLTRVTFARLR